MEQLEFDCRLDSERELEENVNVALDFACKQVKEEAGDNKVKSRHAGYGIASEFYSAVKAEMKHVDESMKLYLRILPIDNTKAIEAASSLKNAVTRLVLEGTKLAAQADRIMNDLYEEAANYKTPVEAYLEEFEEAEEAGEADVAADPQEESQEEDE